MSRNRIRARMTKDATASSDNISATTTCVLWREEGSCLLQLPFSAFPCKKWGKQRITCQDSRPILVNSVGPNTVTCFK